eukprot:6648734-Pyramimonas_sp.AAC.1
MALDESSPVKPSHDNNDKEELPSTARQAHRGAPPAGQGGERNRPNRRGAGQVDLAEDMEGARAVIVMSLWCVLYKTELVLVLILAADGA